MPSKFGIRLCHLVLYLTCAQNVLKAQQPNPATSLAERIRFERLTIEQGLSQSNVLCILQDHKGFMWFGTGEGLNKYDGYEFTVYKQNTTLWILPRYRRTMLKPFMKIAPAPFG